MKPRDLADLMLLAAVWGSSFLFMHLIANVGAARGTSVTVLIPVFAVLWGTLFLSESLTLVMALGCTVILLGTSLTTGVFKLRRA